MTAWTCRGVAVLAILVTPLSGCAVVPLAASAGVAAATNASVGGAVSFEQQVRTMNCTQLRAEYAKLQADTLGNFNPFAQKALKTGLVTSAAQQRGCRL